MYEATPPTTYHLEAKMQAIKPQFLAALAKVERLHGQDDGDCGGKGPFQIRDIYRRDVNRICAEQKILNGDDEIEFFTAEDLLSMQRAALCTKIYLVYWGNYHVQQGTSLDWEDLCSLHRWGGPGWNPNWKEPPHKGDGRSYKEWLIDYGRTQRLRSYLGH